MVRLQESENTISKKRETVLVIEDEEITRDLAKEILELSEYNVLTANN
jgi:CheY-like chemotaxis protein